MRDRISCGRILALLLSSRAHPGDSPTSAPSDFDRAGGCSMFSLTGIIRHGALSIALSREVVFATHPWDSFRDVTFNSHTERDLLYVACAYVHLPSALANKENIAKSPFSRRFGSYEILTSDLENLR